MISHDSSHFVSLLKPKSYKNLLFELSVSKSYIIRNALVIVNMCGDNNKDS